jgi:hypothetical protein
MFADALALAKKPKSKAEARRSLQEIGIITASGDLSEHYKSREEMPKTLAKKVVQSRGKIKTTKARSKGGA